MHHFFVTPEQVREDNIIIDSNIILNSQKINDSDKIFYSDSIVNDTSRIYNFITRESRSRDYDNITFYEKKEEQKETNNKETVDRNKKETIHRNTETKRHESRKKTHSH